MISYLRSNITEVEADIIVNASNGIGWMGGIIGRFFKLEGVAESIHYIDHSIEKEAKRVCKNKKIAVGDVFITESGKLSCKYILHAVTMKMPGTESSESVIEECVKNIITAANKLNVKTVALPLLGSGTGRVNKEKVKEIYNTYFKDELTINYIVVEI